MGQMYGIFRIEKHKSVGGGLEKENNRDAGMAGKFDFKNSEIDWQRTSENVFLMRADDWKKTIDQQIASRLKKPPRKTAVRALEGFYGASPEWFKDKNRSDIIEYFKACLEFHKKYYGDVVNAVIHFDEATPHMHVISIPFTQDGRLSAFELLGDRKKMSKSQDAFFNEVCKDRGLVRGEIREPENARKHMDLAQFKMKKEQEKAMAAEQEATRQQARLNAVLRDINVQDDLETRVRDAVKSASPKTYMFGLMQDDKTMEMPREKFLDLRADASRGAAAMASLRTLDEQKKSAEADAKSANDGLEIARKNEAAADARRQKIEQEAAPFLEVPQAARGLVGTAIEQVRRVWIGMWETAARCMAAAVICGKKPHQVGKEYAGLIEKLEMPRGDYFPKHAAQAMRKQAKGKTPQIKSGSGWKIHPAAVDYRKPIENFSSLSSLFGANTVPATLRMDADNFAALRAAIESGDQKKSYSRK